MLEMKSVRRVFRACCEKKGMLLLVLPRHELTIQVVPTGPPSPPSSSSDLSISKSNSETYYRPSIPIIINHLKRKVEHFAAPEQYEKYDHLVRGLGRDGLLESSANQELVTCKIPSSSCRPRLISSGEIERVYRTSGTIPTSHDTSLFKRAIRVRSFPSPPPKADKTVSRPYRRTL